jgi:very-short-patch-repair endonuclease
MVVCKECNREFESLDSLRRHRSQKHNINAEQTYVDYKLDGIPPTCACGCGGKPNFLSIEKGFVDYIRGHSQRINNNWGHNPEAIKKSHDTQRKMHADGTLKVWNDGLTIEDPRVRDNIDKVMANPERSKNISKKLIGVEKSVEHKEAIKLAADLRWSNPEEREKQSHRRMEYIIKNGFQVKSKLEETFLQILKSEFNLDETKDYYRQFYIRDIKALFDFKIKGKNILIEVDGDYWHCNPNTKFNEPVYAAQKANLIQDKIKEQWCVDNEYKLLRFWETDINTKPEEIIKTLKKELGYEEMYKL